jgi:periplasmic nitrate reductase NapD
MNISSVVVKTKKENLEAVMQAIKECDFCEYHLHNEKGLIVVTIEGEGVEEEIRSLKQLKAIPNVISAEMIYSYAEDELEAERSKLLKSGVPEWLNDPEITADNINYGGDLKKRF